MEQIEQRTATHAKEVDVFCWESKLSPLPHPRDQSCYEGDRQKVFAEIFILQDYLYIWHRGVDGLLADFRG